MAPEIMWAGLLKAEAVAVFKIRNGCGEAIRGMAWLPVVIFVQVWAGWAVATEVRSVFRRSQRDIDRFAPRTTNLRVCDLEWSISTLSPGANLCNERFRPVARS